jgi:hypothetical protein
LPMPTGWLLPKRASQSNTVKACPGSSHQGGLSGSTLRRLSLASTEKRISGRGAVRGMRSHANGKARQRCATARATPTRPQFDWAPTWCASPTSELSTDAQGDTCGYGNGMLGEYGVETLIPEGLLLSGWRGGARRARYRSVSTPSQPNRKRADTLVSHLPFCPTFTFDGVRVPGQHHHGQGS